MVGVLESKAENQAITLFDTITWGHEKARGVTKRLFTIIGVHIEVRSHIEELLAARKFQSQQQTNSASKGIWMTSPGGAWERSVICGFIYHLVHYSLCFFITGAFPPQHPTVNTMTCFSPSLPFQIQFLPLCVTQECKAQDTIVIIKLAINRHHVPEAILGAFYMISTTTL